MAYKDKEEQRTYQKEKYYYYKSKGICTRCGHRESEPNNILCLECKEADNEQKRNRYKNDEEFRYKHLEMTKIQAKERRKERKEQGLCIVCGKAKINKPYSETRCVECYIKRKESEKRLNINKILRQDRYYYDMCYNCSKKGLYNGTHYCKECWNKMSEDRKKWWKEHN